MSEYAVKLAANATVGVALRALSIAWTFFANAAEKELQDATGHDLKKLGARARCLQPAWEQVLHRTIKEGDKQAAELWARRHIEDFVRGCETLNVNLDDTLNDFTEGN